MPSKSQMTKAAKGLARLAQTQGVDVAMAALNKRKGSISEEEYKKAAEFIQQAASVPQMNNGGVVMDYGEDPFAQGFQMGSPRVSTSKIDEEELQRQLAQQKRGLAPVGARTGDPLGGLGGAVVGGLAKKALGSTLLGPLGAFFKDGGYPGWQHYAQGEDSVRAMLTPGEAVIPAPAAQDPANKPMIDSMINQGRQMNRGAPAKSPMEGQQSMQGPLSGKTKRENMKVEADIRLKEKSWLADEGRKAEAARLKMEQDKEMHQLKMEQMKQQNAQKLKQARE